MARVTPRKGSQISFRRVELDATPDDPIVRSMLHHGTELEPDPRFARRLRGIILSRHVAAREGYVAAPRRGSMTPIGRGVLVSSVLLAVSVGTVGAFSQSAIPGDPLYELKLRLESLRVTLAPAEVQDALLAMALEERASELARAAEAGRWDAAQEAAWRVVVAEEQLVARNGLHPGVAARVQAHLRALDQVLAHAPARAAAVVAERLDPARDVLDDRGSGNSASPPDAGGGTGANGGGAGGGHGASPATGGARSPKPTSSPAPARTPPTPTQRPSPSDRPSQSTHASPSGQATTEAPVN